MMRDRIAPVLREMGFRGSFDALRYSSGDYAASVSVQKSRYSTTASVEFWIHLGAVHTPTNTAYWSCGLQELIPESRARGWKVGADGPVEPVAADILGAFRDYGWPAIQAVLDSPGYPPDLAIRWARTFPPVPSPAVQPAAGPDHGPLDRVVRRTGRTADDLLAALADDDRSARLVALGEIGRRADDDPRTIPAILDRLEDDPDRFARRTAALLLIPRAGRQPVRQALRAAAAEDEDIDVRWAARYALRLSRLVPPEEADSWLS